MKDKYLSYIFDYFIVEMCVIFVQFMEEDIVEMKDLEVMKKQGNLDRERVKWDRLELKKEQDMFKRVREVVGMLELDDMQEIGVFEMRLVYGYVLIVV